MKNYHLVKNQSKLYPWMPVLIIIAIIAVWLLALFNSKPVIIEPELKDKCAIWQLEGHRLKINVKHERLIRKQSALAGKPDSIVDC